MTPDQHLQAAKEAVAKKHGFNNWHHVLTEHKRNLLRSIDIRAMLEEAALLALTNQAEELRKPKENSAHGKNCQNACDWPNCTLPNCVEKDAALSNLLAVMHGDGGHYQSEHGTLKAIEEAQKLLHTKWVATEPTTATDSTEEENCCSRCGGMGQIEQGGEIVDCYMCKGSGEAKKVEPQEPTRKLVTEELIEYLEAETEEISHHAHKVKMWLYNEVIPKVQSLKAKEIDNIKQSVKAMGYDGDNYLRVVYNQ